MHKNVIKSNKTPLIKFEIIQENQGKNVYNKMKQAVKSD
jgi:hypothetical protein